MKDLDLLVSKRLSPPLYSSTHAEIIQIGRCFVSAVGQYWYQLTQQHSQYLFTPPGWKKAETKKRCEIPRSLKPAECGLTIEL